MNPEIVKNYDLSGQTALVTGATGGIGGDITRILSQAGAKIIVHTVTNRDGAEMLASELGNAHAVCADISSEDGVKSLFDQLAAEQILPDLLVNNAGIQALAGVLDADEAVWRDINNVNLGGIFATTKIFSETLIAEKKPGAIVNIASIEGLDPAEAHSHYAASKAGVIMFTRASALELGKHSIRVNAVSPGLISRPGIEEQWPDGVKRWRERAPMRQMGAGQDIGNAVHFLLCPAARWITGANLVVDGGMSSQNRW